jgi:hypothetical protein
LVFLSLSLGGPRFVSHEACQRVGAAAGGVLSA